MIKGQYTANAAPPSPLPFSKTFHEKLVVWLHTGVFQLLFNAVSAEKESNVTGAPYVWNHYLNRRGGAWIFVSPPPPPPETVYFSMDFSTAFILYTEVMADQQKSYLCFRCARLESKYWNSVSTFGAHLHFQYHSFEEIVYFLMDYIVLLSFNIFNIPKSHREQQELYRCFHCARLESKYWNSVSTFGALLHFQ